MLAAKKADLSQYPVTVATVGGLVMKPDLWLPRPRNNTLRPMESDVPALEPNKHTKILSPSCAHTVALETPPGDASY